MKALDHRSTSIGKDRRTRLAHISKSSFFLKAIFIPLPIPNLVIYLLDFYSLKGLQMGVEYSSTEVRISDRKTLAADSYCMVHSGFDLE